MKSDRVQALIEGKHQPWIGVLVLVLQLLGASSLAGQRPVGPVGPEFQVNSYTTSTQYRPSVAVDLDGDFVVIWDSRGSGGSDTSDLSIQGQRFGPAGNTLESQFQVNSYTTDNQVHPSVAVDPDGDFVVVWSSDGSSGSDTSDSSIQGQRFGALFADGFESGDTSAWSSTVP